MTYDQVFERLVEAIAFLRRMPDREATWMRSAGVSSIWRQSHLSRAELWSLYQIDSDDYDRDALPTLPGLRSAEVDRMWEALDWMQFVMPRDRKLVGLIIGKMSRDDGPQRPPWLWAARQIGFAGHPDTLAKRFGRAVRAIAVGVQRAKMAESFTQSASSPRGLGVSK